jgi:hypothetical protein
MSGEISLQTLIDEVKDELLTPTGGPGYPVFFVDKVELEIAVAIKAEGSGGLNISVLELGGGASSEQSHTVTVTLSPILTREEQRALLEEDERMLEGVKRATQAALRKGGSGMVGEPE